MSRGVWTRGFCAFKGARLLLEPGFMRRGCRAPDALAGVALCLTAGLVSAVLATYTASCSALQLFPSAAHHKRLPFHVGIVGLGSAVPSRGSVPFGALTRSPCRSVRSNRVGVWLEIARQGARAIHHGRSGLLLRVAALLTGPVPLAARTAGWVPIAAVCFLGGAVCSRYGWIFAGRVSATDPEETIATQNRRA